MAKLLAKDIYDWVAKPTVYISAQRPPCDYTKAVTPGKKKAHIGYKLTKDEFTWGANERVRETMPASKEEIRLRYLSMEGKSRRTVTKKIDMVEQVGSGKTVTKTIHMLEADASSMTRMSKKARYVLIPRLGEKEVQERGACSQYDG